MMIWDVLGKTNTHSDRCQQHLSDLHFLIANELPKKHFASTTGNATQWDEFFLKDIMFFSPDASIGSENFPHKAAFYEQTLEVEITECIYACVHTLSLCFDAATVETLHNISVQNISTTTTRDVMHF